MDSKSVKAFSLFVLLFFVILLSTPGGIASHRLIPPYPASAAPSLAFASTADIVSVLAYGVSAASHGFWVFKVLLWTLWEDVINTLAPGTSTLF
ncbi:hypothetical protein Sjap_026066 [Stephania japonica]|uniref:Uncharacterized protein n=1 Tax=Stephania japonica TaxID=461633 RepID=A0AAP0E5E4_9MAGN